MKICNITLSLYMPVCRVFSTYHSRLCYTFTCSVLVWKCWKQQRITGPVFIHIISAPNFKSRYMFVVAGGTEKLINQRMW